MALILRPVLRLAAVLGTLAVGACAYSGAPESGKQQCAPEPSKRCPDGYYCAADTLGKQVCWLNGTGPDGGEGAAAGTGGSAGGTGRGGTGGGVIGLDGGIAGTGGGIAGTGGSVAGKGGGVAGPDGGIAGTGGSMAGTGGGDTGGAAGGPPPAYMLSVVKAGTGTGRVTATPAGIDCGSDCFESYPAGTAVTLTAAADASSTFAGWSGGCTGTTATCTVTVSAAATVTATFTLRTRNLTAMLAGTGGGTVTSSPAGINCGTDCTEAYNHGTVVALTATPNGQSLFTGWSGACTGSGACSVTMDQARTVTATFTLQSYGLTVVKGGNGATLGTVTSVPAGIDCGADCSEAYASGTTVTLTAAAAAGVRFTGWSNATCGTAATCMVTITGVVSVMANFTLMDYALTVQKAGVGSGTVSSAPAGITCGTTCTASFPHGTMVALAAVADASSLFTGWGGACSGTGPCVVNLTAASSVTATFVPTYVITTAVSGGPAGTVIAPTSTTAGAVCSGSMCRVPAGGSVSATAPALNNWFFNGWAGVASATTAAVTVANVTASGTLTARYINTRQEPCRDSPPANATTSSRPNVTTTYTTAAGWSMPALCPWACNEEFCQTASSTCVAAFVNQIVFTTGTSSKWFGGDDRPMIGPRNVGTGQSVTPSSAVVMERFSFHIGRPFSYASTGTPATMPLQLRLQRRDPMGNLIVGYITTVPADYDGEWINWTTPTTTLPAGTKQIFTAWLGGAFTTNQVNTGTRGDSAAGFALGEGYSADEANESLQPWASWSPHAWDFHFRIQRRNTSCQ